MNLTYRYRIKTPSARRALLALSRSVNKVFNHCNEISLKHFKETNKYLSKFDLNKLHKGKEWGKDLCLHSQTTQAVCEEFAIRKKQFKKQKLNWRVSNKSSSRYSLGWIPFKSVGIKFNLESGKITYSCREYKLFYHRALPFGAKIKTGSFTEEPDGNWYVNLVVSIPENINHKHKEEFIAADPGLKTSLVFSNGDRVENLKTYLNLQDKLAKAQRHHKKKQVTKLHKKIKNIRKDHFHKEATRIAKTYKTIFIGDVSAKALQARFGKSSQDASIGIIKSLLAYKAQRLGGVLIEIKENNSTVTCSTCLNKTGPSGLRNCGVREWICSTCGTRHDRDINSALNILRLGHESLRAVNAA